MMRCKRSVRITDCKRCWLRIVLTGALQIQYNLMNSRSESLELMD